MQFIFGRTFCFIYINIHFFDFFVNIYLYIYIYIFIYIQVIKSDLYKLYIITNSFVLILCILFISQEDPIEFLKNQ